MRWILYFLLALPLHSAAQENWNTFEFPKATMAVKCPQKMFKRTVKVDFQDYGKLKHYLLVSNRLNVIPPYNHYAAITVAFPNLELEESKEELVAFYNLYRDTRVAERNGVFRSEKKLMVGDRPAREIVFEFLGNNDHEDEKEDTPRIRKMMTCRFWIEAGIIRHLEVETDSRYYPNRAVPLFLDSFSKPSDASN